MEAQKILCRLDELQHTINHIRMDVLGDNANFGADVNKRIQALEGAILELGGTVPDENTDFAGAFTQAAQ
ncbi:hypothetical protein F5984_18810 [Rudanella paleaurantiibacter]|uniref:Uncharacterized protein n=1 Tax=Rudanella paleaurantiibacter TaxID=2614655 RepID=A0A7J5TVV2_9BACT|nr:hypothetical protein F5984_18810 [Rudanella paleaurantiibacter]